MVNTGVHKTVRTLPVPTLAAAELDTGLAVMGEAAVVCMILHV